MLSAVDCVLTLNAQQPAMVSTAGLGISAAGGARTGRLYAHYMGALFLPRRMAVYYPYERLVPVAEVVLAGLVLAVVTAMAFRAATGGHTW